MRQEFDCITDQMCFFSRTRPFFTPAGLPSLRPRTRQFLFCINRKIAEDKRLTQEAIRNYGGIGRSGFHFHLDDISDLLSTFVIPHIRDLDNKRYFQNLDIATAEAKDLP